MCLVKVLIHVVLYGSEAIAVGMKMECILFRLMSLGRHLLSDSITRQWPDFRWLESQDNMVLGNSHIF